MYARWPKGAYPVALSEEGIMFDSSSMARWIQKRAEAATPLIFNIGGAYGLTSSLKKKCRETVSLSPLTFPYRLCLIILLEQLYRSWTILRGHPYHK
jgi:23S rRNA (pseudouridine1915-N3)-methyltransferase